MSARDAHAPHTAVQWQKAEHTSAEHPTIGCFGFEEVTESHDESRQALPFPDFAFVDFAMGGVKRRNNPVLVDQVRANGTADSYATIHRFPDTFRQHVERTGSVARYVGPSWADFLVRDIDRLDDLKAARRDTVALAHLLVDSYEVNTAQIRIFFSGQKGFHLLLPTQLVGGLAPSEHLPALLKELALQLADEAGVETDRAIYDRTRLLRLPNTKHGRSGLFKVELTWDELTNLDAGAIRSLAASPRDFRRALGDLEPVERLEALLERLGERKPPGPSPVAKAPRRGLADGDSVISTWNERVPVGEVLERNGYQQDPDADPPRWLAPGSSTGEHGVVQLEDGRVFSHHSECPLHGSHSHDSFGVLAVLEHGGDHKAAARSAARGLGLSRYVARPARAKVDPVQPEAAQEPVGAEPGPDPGPDRKSGWRAELDRELERLNSRYFVADLHGSTIIASSQHDPILKREHLVFTRPQDFRLLYANVYVVTEVKDDGAEVRRPLGQVWLSHPSRRTYYRMALIPDGEVPEGTYNLWRGFGVEPRAGAWPRIEHHLREVICDGDEGALEWLLNWMARCVQRPGERAEVAVVLRGLKGVGKGAFASLLLNLFRRHSLHLSNGRHLVGNFNAHLVDVLFLFLDEAFWAGDKAGEGVLKALITESSMMIEPKGVNAFMAANRLKIVMASNADWVVPATADERRYFVLDVSDRHKGDSAYFRDLFDAIGKDGAEGTELSALLHDLLERDLSDFNHRTVPHTDALNAQKLVGGDALVKWWFDCLTCGEIAVPRSSYGKDDEDGRIVVDGWPQDMPIQLVHECYTHHARIHGDRHPITSAEMGRRLREMLPGLKESRPRRRFRTCTRPVRYVFPELDACRADFLKHMNIAEHDWCEGESDPHAKDTP